MLANSKVATRLPAQEPQRARMFYADKLGLQPVDEHTEGLLYRCGGSEFALFKSASAPSREHTQMVWEVEDIHAVVGELRGRGVAFEQYDVPGLTMADGIADVQGGWPSKGDKGLRVAWFKDSEGNLLSLGQHIH
jgi:catechol 2,3-dioxygenase-like lactoylglutathione lyase family enzyme